MMQWLKWQTITWLRGHYRMWVIGILVFVISLELPSKGVGQGVTPQAVQEAIDQFSSYFRRTQTRSKGERDGAWQGHEDQGAGLTSLIVLALLSSGRSPNDAEIARAMEYIRREKPKKVYEASLQCMAMCACQPGRDRDLIERNIAWLVKAQQRSDGGWAYDQQIGMSDESNSQFAVLAFWEASKIGVEIPADTLQRAKGYWMTQMLPGGTWGYRQDRAAKGSMTCAGIASMIILDDALISSDAAVEGEQIVCCGGGREKRNYDPSISIEWLAENFSVNDNPGHREWYMYYMYALERVGRLTGQRFIGNHDWYREGADAIIRRRDTVGGKMRGGNSETEVAATAMALLFLSKGKRQVVMGHLQHGVNPNSNDWNRHRRSVQHLTGHIELAWKRDLAWQSLRIQRATLPDLLETPVLFISGADEFILTPQHRRLLKDYVDQGGFIFAEACNGDGCRGNAFEESFRKEMELIFDKPLQKLPPTHPIWSAEARINPEALPEGFWLYGLEACCRTSVVLSPSSLSCRWELSKPYGAKPNYPKKVKEQLDNAVKIGLNVVAYATGRELKDKLEAVQIVQADLDRQSQERGSLAIAKIMHSGGGDETPRSLSNLLELYRRETKAMVEPKTPKIAASSPEMDKYPIAYIHGRSKFVFSDDELKGMRRHIENGGTVLGDAICGAEDFADSVRREFSRALPDAIWRTLPPDHPIMLKEGPGGFDLRNVALIDPTAGGKDVQAAKREGPAEIEALEWNGRLVVLFSPNDLSCALESKHSLQCRGYTREDAFRIGMNLILYSLMQ